MTALYVDQAGAVVGRRGEQIIVSKRGDATVALPVTQVERVLVGSRAVQVTTQALALLSNRGIDVVFLTRSGRLIGRFSPPVRRDASIRLTQSRAVMDERLRLEFARDIVGGKVANQAEFLDRHGASEAGRRLRASLRQVHASGSLEQLRGVEGAAARLYFAVWRTLVPASTAFRGRMYHPPTDTINAALSYAYTLLLREGLAACESAGLDAHIGFLHEPGPAKPSLALDLIEEFRPLVADSIVMAMARRDRLMRAGSGIPAHLSDATRNALLTEFESRMQLSRRAWDGVRTSYRRCVQRQAQQFAFVLTGKRSRYRPLTWSK